MLMYRYLMIIPQQTLFNRVYKRRNPAYEEQLDEGPEFLK